MSLTFSSVLFTRGMPLSADITKSATGPLNAQQQPLQRARPSASFAKGPAPAASGSRIDPAQIPRPRAGVAADPGEDADATEPMVFETRQAGKHALPPPTSSRYMCAPITASPAHCRPMNEHGFSDYVQSLWPSAASADRLCWPAECGTGGMHHRGI